MQTDYLDAHQRHWDDAETLFSSQRWANADHLYGISAECGLKQLMLTFGMQFNHDKQKPEKREDATHIELIWRRYESYRSGHDSPNYAIPQDPNPFQDWDIHQRYAHQQNFDLNKTEPHKNAANLIATLIRQAKTDGLIP
jgi:hypothetical protein